MGNGGPNARDRRRGLPSCKDTRERARKAKRPRRAVRSLAHCCDAYFFFATAFLAAGLAAATLSALRLAAFGSTAALNEAPGTNFGTFCAAILILVPA